MAWGIYSGQKKGKKLVLDRLFPKRREAVKEITKLKSIGLKLPLYTKKTKKKGLL